MIFMIILVVKKQGWLLTGVQALTAAAMTGRFWSAGDNQLHCSTVTPILISIIIIAII